MTNQSRVLCIVNRDNHHQAQSVVNFSFGCTGVCKSIDWWKQHKDARVWWSSREDGTSSRYSAIVLQGILRGNGDLLKWIIANKLRYYYIDHAYFLSGYKPNNQWMRVTQNKFFATKEKNYPRDRWDKLFSKHIQVKEWKNSKLGKIIVLPPTHAMIYVFPQAASWTSTVVDKLKQYTDREIVVREKPNQPIIDERGVIVGRTPAAGKVEEDLNSAYCVVAYNSNVAIRAAIDGIPVICDEEHPAHTVSNRIEDIENLQEFDRQPWLNFLSYNQFNTTEFKNGTAWRMLTE